MFWARQQWAFNRLLNDPDPELAALMHSRGVQHGDIPKLWAEAAYEQARVALAPGKVSRLDALYACFDPIEAFLMIDTGVAISSVWRGQLHEGARWSAAAFDAFEVIRPPVGAVANAFVTAWTELAEHASCYWQPAADGPELEVLVAGEIDFTDRVSLRAILVEQGFLPPTPPLPDNAAPEQAE